MLHDVGFGMINDDVLQCTFLKRLNFKSNKRNSNECWLQCRKDYGVCMSDAHDFCFPCDDSFPWNKKDNFDSFVGTVLKYNQINSAGPWDMTITKTCSDDESDDNNIKELVSKKAFNSIDEFMVGNFSCHLQLPCHDKKQNYQLCIVSSFKKETRPKAWIGVDLKIQYILPLVGIVPIENDDVDGAVTTAMEEDDTKDFIVKIECQLNRKDNE